MSAEVFCGTSNVVGLSGGMVGNSILDLFSEVCDLPEDERRAKFAATGATPEQIQEVNELVAALGARTSVLTRIVRSAGEFLTQQDCPPLEKGARLGPWRIEARLAEGGMGQIYTAQRSDGHFEQTAAIKILTGVASASALARLTQERQILATLSHPNIARLLDGGSTETGQPYLVMEYVSGKDILTYCQEGGLSTAGVLRLFIDVCSAVGFAHRQLIVHCDLKPSNILVEEDSGRVVLLDFGIANLIDATGSRKAYERAYTLEYSSPEQRLGHVLTTATDIYSLGLILRELLPEPISEDLLAIISKACAEDVDLRYESVGALTEDLNRFLAKLPVSAVPASLLYTSKKFAQRRWPWLLAGAGFSLSLAVLGTRIVHERDSALSARQEANSQRDLAVAAQQAATVSAALAQRQSEVATAAEIAAKLNESKARDSEQLAKANALKANLAQSRAEEQAQISTAKSDFFSQVFASHDSVLPLNASSSVRDLLRAAKQKFVAGNYSGKNLEAKRSIANLLAAAFESVGDGDERLKATHIELDTLNELRDKGLGSGTETESNLATILMQLATQYGSRGDTTAEAAYAQKFLKLVKFESSATWPAHRLGEYVVALQALISNENLEASVASAKALLKSAERIPNLNERRSLLSLIYKSISQMYSRLGRFEDALIYGERAIANHPETNEGVKVGVDLASTMVDRLDHLFLAGHISAGIAYYSEIEKTLLEKEPDGGMLLAVARQAMCGLLERSGRYVDAFQLEAVNRIQLEKHFGIDSGRVHESKGLGLRAMLGAGRFKEVWEIAGEESRRSDPAYLALPVHYRTRYAFFSEVGRFHVGDRRDAVAGMMEILKSRRPTGGLGMSVRTTLIDALMDLSDLEAAERLVQEGDIESVAQTNRLPFARPVILFNLAKLASRRGDWASADRYFDRAEAAVAALAGETSPAALVARSIRAYELVVAGQRPQAQALRDDMRKQLEANGQQEPEIWQWRRLRQALAVQ